MPPVWKMPVSVVLPVEHDTAVLMLRDLHDAPRLFAIEHCPSRVLRSDRDRLGDRQQVAAAAAVRAVGEHELAAVGRAVQRLLERAHAGLHLRLRHRPTYLPKIPGTMVVLEYL